MPDLKPYIPGTDEYRRRKFQEYYTKMQGDGEVLLEVEWPDGTLSYEPGQWITKLSAYKGARTDNLFFARGQGRRKKQFGGATVIHVFASNAAVSSTEAAIAADRREHGDYREASTTDGDVFVKDDDDRWVDASTGETVATDGGQVAGVEDKVMDLAPPGARLTEREDDEELSLEFDYDGQAFSLKEAADYDPNPVDQLDLQAVMDYVRASEIDEEEKIKYLLIGVAVGFGLLALTLVGMWLMGQIGGGGGGVSGVSMFLGGGML